MSSIPLVAMGVRPPDIANPTDQMAKAVQLRSMIQQQKMIPGQLEAQQRENEARQQENQIRGLQIQDEQALRDSAKGIDWTKPDAFDKLVTNAQSKGVSPGKLTQMAQQRAAYQEQLAKTDNETLKADATKTNMLLGHIDAIKSAKPEERASVARMQASQILQAGLAKDPQSQQMLQGMVNGQNIPTDQDLDHFEAGLTDHKTQVEQQFKERETAAKEQEATARVTSAQTASTRLQAEMPGGAMQPVEQKELSAYLTANPGKTALDFAKLKASLAPQAQINVQGNLGGTQGDALAGAVANGSMKIGDVLTARTPLPIRQQFLNKVMSINPQFNSANYDIEKGVMKDFTSGKSAQNLNAFNTAIEHANQLSKATDALDNSDVVGLNKIGNALGYQFGSDKTTNFNVIKNALAGEVSKVFKGGQATDAEIKAVEQPFDAANSPTQLKGAIKNAISLMNSKRDALKQQYEQGRKAQPNFKDQGSDSLSVKAPNGKTYSFKDQQSLDNFKKAAGIQ